MKKLIFLLLVLFLTACQSSDSNTSNVSNTNEGKEILLYHNRLMKITFLSSINKYNVYTAIGHFS